MSEELSLSKTKQEWHGSFRAYLLGFWSCLLLTTLSFFFVTSELFTPKTTALIISFLALFQAIYQLKYFLHLGQEGSPYWESLIFSFMVLILLIIALGSLWVMNDLNERTMSMPMSTATHEMNS